MHRPREQITGQRILHPVAFFLQQCHIPAQGGGVAGYVDDPAGGKPGQRLDGLRLVAGGLEVSVDLEFSHYILRVIASVSRYHYTIRADFLQEKANKCS